MAQVNRPAEEQLSMPSKVRMSENVETANQFEPLDLSTALRDCEVESTELRMPSPLQMNPEVRCSEKKRPSNSELALNTYIRKLTGNLLDRRLPIAQQPPQRLLHIETLCQTQFPQYDTKQIRLKIRAQLKLHRRNLKKANDKAAAAAVISSTTESPVITPSSKHGISMQPLYPKALTPLAHALNNEGILVGQWQKVGDTSNAGKRVNPVVPSETHNINTTLIQQSQPIHLTDQLAAHKPCVTIGGALINSLTGISANGGNYSVNENSLPRQPPLTSANQRATLSEQVDHESMNSILVTVNANQTNISRGETASQPVKRDPSSIQPGSTLLMSPLSIPVLNVPGMEAMSTAGRFVLTPNILSSISTVMPTSITMPTFTSAPALWAPSILPARPATAQFSPVTITSTLLAASLRMSAAFLLQSAQLFESAASMTTGKFETIFAPSSSNASTVLTSSPCTQSVETLKCHLEPNTPCKAEPKI